VIIFTKTDLYLQQLNISQWDMKIAKKELRNRPRRVDIVVGLHSSAATYTCALHHPPARSVAMNDF
jgi:hypothetical protein